MENIKHLIKMGPGHLLEYKGVGNIDFKEDALKRITLLHEIIYIQHKALQIICAKKAEGLPEKTCKWAMHEVNRIAREIVDGS